MSSNMPKTIGLCAASYRAEQVPGAVLIFAHGIHSTSGYAVFFEKSPIDVFPPEFSLWHVKPSGIVLEVITGFTEHTNFAAKDKVDTVVVHDANGKHEVPVEQVPDVAIEHLSDQRFLIEEASPVENKPGTPAECVAWRDQEVRSRIRAAIAEWADEPVGNITSDMTLGELAKQTPWGMAQQIQLVKITNHHQVFAPFESVMTNPDAQSDSTTVSDWEGVVWENQDPQTFCYPYGN